jgi:hypothetical protein
LDANVHVRERCAERRHGICTTRDSVRERLLVRIHASLRGYARVAMGSDLSGPLEELRDGLRTVRLELEVPGREEAQRVRDDLVAQVDDYVLPRLQRMDAPTLIVVGGSTGAGKSTVVNSLVGAVVSRAGVLRPTTLAPALVCHPADLGWFDDDRSFPVCRV